MAGAEVRTGAVVGLDLGSRRVGVAVSDRAATLALPHSVLERSGDEARDRAALVRVVEEVDAVRVVIGLPLSLDGSDGPAARAVRAQADELARQLSVPVELADERFSSVEANRSLDRAGVGGRRRRQVVDEVAASVLLQSWLDRRAARSAVGTESPSGGSPSGGGG